MSYYDIDSILTDAQVSSFPPMYVRCNNHDQKVPCTFELDVPNLGYLDNNPGHDLKASTRLELPLWLSEMLAVSSPQASSALVTLDLPSSLSPRVLNALKADPKTVDLRALAPHFYSLGARILELFEEEEILDILVDTFRKRAAEIADHANNAGSRGGSMGEGADFLRGLDESERGLFRKAHDGTKAMRVWMGEMKKR
jgi:GINS complex subunit 3